MGARKRSPSPSSPFGKKGFSAGTRRTAARTTRVANAYQPKADITGLFCAVAMAAAALPTQQLAFLPAFHSPFRAIVLFACATVIVLQDLAWAGDSLKVDTAGALWVCTSAAVSTYMGAFFTAPSGGSIAAALCPAAELACVALPALSWLLLTRRSSSGTLVVLKDALSHRPEALRRLAALLCLTIAQCLALVPTISWASSGRSGDDLPAWASTAASLPRAFAAAPRVALALLAARRAAPWKSGLGWVAPGRIMAGVVAACALAAAAEALWALDSPVNALGALLGKRGGGLHAHADFHDANGGPVAGQLAAAASALVAIALRVVSREALVDRARGLKRRLRDFHSDLASTRRRARDLLADPGPNDAALAAFVDRPLILFIVETRELVDDLRGFVRDARAALGVHRLQADDADPLPEQPPPGAGAGGGEGSPHGRAAWRELREAVARLDAALHVDVWPALGLLSAAAADGRDDADDGLYHLLERAASVSRAARALLEGASIDPCALRRLDFPEFDVSHGVWHRRVRAQAEADGRRARAVQAPPPHDEWWHDEAEEAEEEEE